MTFHSGISRRAFLAGTAGLGAAAVLHPYAALAQAGQAHLRIMETTDLHVAVFPYDYYADMPNDTLGLARTAALIDQIRSEAGNSVLLDNGDVIQGNPMGDYIAYEKGLDDAPHPVIAAMNVLGYEAGTLGNHEFNYGLDFLGAALAGANFPIVSANLVNADGTPFIEPYRIIEKQLTDGSGATHTIRLGLIGFLPPQIMTWDSSHLAGKVDTIGIIEAAQKYVPEMREKGVDLVIALSHSGISAELGAGENASLQLAEVEGIDVVLTGHQHLVFPGPDFKDIAGVDVEAGTLAGKPAVMAGFWGSHMGLIDLLLEKADDGTWSIVSHTSQARPIFERVEGKVQPLVESEADVLAAAQAEHDETLAYVRRAVGETAAPLHSYFALVADDPSVQIVNIAQKWYLEQMLAGTEFESLPLLSAAAPFKAGGRGGPDYYTDVPVGPVAIKNVADLYLYPNTIQAVVITGQDVQNWLDRSAGIFNQVEPGRYRRGADQPGVPVLQFRRDRRGDLQDRHLQAGQIRRQGRGYRQYRKPHRRPDVRGQAHRPGAALRRRHQQLPRRWRRHLPRHRAGQDHLQGPRYQPRHHRALHRGPADHPAGRRQQLVAGADWQHRAVRNRPQGRRAPGRRDRRQGRGHRRHQRGRLRHLPHHALSRRAAGHLAARPSADR